MPKLHSINNARVEVVAATLPGQCAATCTRRGGVLWVVVDPAKPDAYDQAGEMLLAASPPAPAPRFCPDRLSRAAMIGGFVVVGVTTMIDAFTPLIDAMA